MNDKEAMQSKAIDEAINQKPTTRQDAAAAVHNIMRDHLTEDNSTEFSRLISYLMKPKKAPRKIVITPAFLAKAVSNDPERSAICVMSGDGEHVYATDGRRMHRVKVELSGRYTYDTKEKTLKIYDDEHADTFPLSTSKGFFDATRTERLKLSHLETSRTGLIMRVYYPDRDHYRDEEPEPVRINHDHYIDAITHDSAPEIFLNRNGQVIILSINTEAVLQPLGPSQH